MGLGPLRDVSLAQARERARAARAKLLDGDDPIELRRAKKMTTHADKARHIAFREAAEKYIAAHKAGWRNEKHAAQWTATLIAYAYPLIGNLSVAAVDVGHVMRILEPIWITKTETASRLRGRIESVLDWAKAHHYRLGDNPARWKGHLENLLPARTKVRRVRHQPAMAFLEVPAFASALRGRDSVSARALEFTVLTAARTGEVIGAKWDEMDLEKKVWTVPGSRMKSGRDHRVPLSERCIAILKAVPRERGSAFVFPGGRPRKPLSNMAMLELLRGMENGQGLTVHGFRSSFRDWAGEQTSYPREIAEAALGHVLGDKTEAAYRRSDALEKRRRLMEAWSGYCARPRTATGNIISIKTAKA
jgi:integrase